MRTLEDITEVTFAIAKYILSLIFFQRRAQNTLVQRAHEMTTEVIAAARALHPIRNRLHRPATQSFWCFIKVLILTFAKGYRF